MVTWDVLEGELRAFVQSEVMAKTLQRNYALSAKELELVDLLGWSGAVACLRFLIANPEYANQIAVESMETT